PVSMAVAGRDSYSQFYKHTLKVHDQTPLTNHMGMRVLVATKAWVQIKPLGIGTTAASGRMEFTKDNKLIDPFSVWKRMRNERYEKYKLIAYALTAMTLAFFVYVTRRIKNLWVAQCLAQVFIILMSQLTCYYYSFMILSAPLTRLRRSMEIPLFALAVMTQVAG